MSPPEEYPGELGQRIKDLDAEIAIIFGQLRKQFPVVRATIYFSLAAVMLSSFLWAMRVNPFIALLSGTALFGAGFSLFRYGWQHIGFHYFLDSLKSALGMAARQYDPTPMENPLFERMQRLDMHRDELIYQITRKRQPSKSYVGTILLVFLAGTIAAMLLGAYFAK